GSAYGLWLNVKGKVVADSFVLRGAGAKEFWLGSYFSPAAAVRERLESHIIADDVTIEDATAAWAGVSVWGAATARAPSGVFRFRGRRSREQNEEWIFPEEKLDAVRASLADARELNGDELARRRIDAAIPAIPTDVGPGDLPNEGGLEAAVSYTKGCYLGQEVMARLKSMGQIRRRLLRVAVTGQHVPILPAPIFVGDRRVGDLRSAVSGPAGGFIGLAMLSLLQVKADSALAFAPEGPPSLRLLDTP
ncbi:MAG TPA: folate-binding protein, partial [Opitutaceae bacterium]|nr:folate-binding protein [Opitutaceae bacterium]